MGEQQTATEVSKCPHPEAVGKRWGDPISEKRRVQLQEMLDMWNAPAANHSNQKGPFDSAMLTGADVYWLAGGGTGNTAPDLYLEGADLSGAHLEGADLGFAHLEGALLRDAHLEDAYLREIHLERADLQGAHLERSILEGAHLDGAILASTHLFIPRGGNFNAQSLRRWDSSSLEDSGLLYETHLEGANLALASLERANLDEAYLEGARLEATDLRGTSLRGAHLEGANLCGSRLDSKTVLNEANFDQATQLRDIQWGGVGAVNLTQIDWERLSKLGDERGVGLISSAKDHAAAVRAYRQVAAQLRAQGLNEVADRFSYRAQVRQRWAHLSALLHDWRRPWRWPGDLARYLGSLFLTALAGYGYRPGRTLFWYVATALSFLGGYWLVTHGIPLFGLMEPSHTQPLHWYEALVLSVASFHGRGFFPQGISLGDPVAILAASEAVIGLFIEISFIATFTQRYFGGK